MAKNKQNPELPRLPDGVMVIDSHCHLDMYDEGARNAVLRTARKAGVNPLITIGIDIPSSQAAIRLAELHPDIYATVGVHPHHAAGLADNDYDMLKAMAAHPKVVAIGEIGLDYVKEYSPASIQRDHYLKQIRLAGSLEKPLVIHDREAHRDILTILAGEKLGSAGGVMHCFSGDTALARNVLDLGLMISLPGIVTYNNAEPLREVARYLPLDRMLLETDAPFLAPVPLRGRQNQPAYMLHTLAYIAALRQLPIRELAMITADNTRKLFRLHPPTR